MKTIKISILSVIGIIAAFLTSCGDNFLEQDPQTSLSTEQLFASMDNIQPYLDGLYYKWRDTRINRKGFFLMLGTDETQQGEYQAKNDAAQGGLDRYDGFYEPANTAIAQLWNIRWPVVVQATEALATLTPKLETANDDEIEKLRSFIGQASFYKGCVLYELASYWGEIPLPRISDSKIVSTPRKPLPEVYAEIEKNLATASRLLPVKSKAANVRIPTRWAADAMLAKMYMSAPELSGFRDFSKALALLQDIQTQGGYSLVKNFADLWNPEKTAGSEAIYTFWFNNVWPDTNELQWYAGSRACSADPNCYIGGYDLLVPTVHCYSDASIGGIWETGDLRKEESIRYTFVYQGKQPQAVAGYGEDQLLPHIKKYEDVRIDGTKTFYNSGKNVYCLRYADILLMLAECLNETGSTADAVRLVNDEIRTRAWGGTLPEAMKWNTAMSPDEFRIKIMEERMRELCFEGWRRLDLIRTGNFVPYISDRNRWAKANGNLSSHHALYPIPLVEIKQNPDISDTNQNPGY